MALIGNYYNRSVIHCSLVLSDIWQVVEWCACHRVLLSQAFSPKVWARNPYFGYTLWPHDQLDYYRCSQSEYCKYIC